MRRDDLMETGPYSFELPPSYRSDMRVPVRVYADPELLDAILQGDAMTQLANVATLPGIDRFAYGMPDMHDGYGFPVGGVAATRLSDGVISPGGVGYDINCGVRLLVSDLDADAIRPKLETIVHD